MTKHDEIRRMFAEHGMTWKGKLPQDMTDQECDDAIAEAVRIMAEFGRMFREAIVPAFRELTAAMIDAMVPLHDVAERIGRDRG